uniref:uncharacterized protein LOC131137170 n=1 Tax=Doryrhamphus excisus TaxID=161450 RepID=UPI0025ADA32F|nr:uncharacterized protein LOC131137170 [Doryrhamphus excisus]
MLPFFTSSHLSSCVITQRKEESARVSEKRKTTPRILYCDAFGGTADDKFFLLMPRERLPVIGSSGGKTVKPPSTNGRKRSQKQKPSAKARPAPFQADSTMTPWRGLVLSDSSFTSIYVPPSPTPLQSTPYNDNQNKELTLSFNSQSSSPTVRADSTNGELQKQQKMPTQATTPRLPRLPPLHPITNLSFSRSFTFSFFELPLYQSPPLRSERMRNLMKLLRETHY